MDSMRNVSSIAIVVVVIVGSAGCASSSAQMVPRRETRSQLAVSSSRQPIPFPELIILEPSSAVQTLEGVKITVRHVPHGELDQFFQDATVFGKNAGKNPYPRETIVFYVTITNNSGGKIRINPADFVMIDDLSTQYQYLSPDGLVEIVEVKGNVYQFAKTTASAAPGVYGAPLSFAASLAGSNRWRHTLLRQVEFQGGYVHNGIIYDGYIAFLRPHQEARAIRLLLANIKLRFDPDDRAQQSLDFLFEFTIQSAAPVGLPQSS